MRARAPLHIAAACTLTGAQTPHAKHACRRAHNQYARAHERHARTHMHPHTCTHAHTRTCVYNPHQVRQSAAAGLRREGNWRLVVVPGAGCRCESRKPGAGGGGTAPGNNTLIKGEQEPTVVRGHRPPASREYDFKEGHARILSAVTISKGIRFFFRWFVPCLQERADGLGQPWGNAGLRPRTFHSDVCRCSTTGRRVIRYARHGRECG